MSPVVKIIDLNSTEPSVFRSLKIFEVGKTFLKQSIEPAFSTDEALQKHRQSSKFVKILLELLLGFLWASDSPVSDYAIIPNTCGVPSGKRLQFANLNMAQSKFVD